jgi:thiosulfate reductase/polysulfide reductase chain A
MGSLPKYPGLPSYPETEEKVKHYPFEFLQATTSLKEATLSADPYPIKGWIAYGSNLIKTLPNPKETIEAIQKLEMFAVVDVLPSDTIAYADVVLPECTYFERYDDLKLGFFKSFEVSLRVPAVEPMFESKPSWWITKELGKRLGLEAYFPWQDFEGYLKTRCDLAGIPFEELKTIV